MALRKQEWPEPGDLIIATVETVTDYGAYVKLDEFEKRGLLHVSEISSSWIRNIRDFVREGQKVVLKVLRVDMEKGHIDLSLRRVTKRERIEKIMVWKKERKAEALLRGVAEKAGVPVGELYEKVGVPLESEYERAGPVGSQGGRDSQSITQNCARFERQGFFVDRVITRAGFHCRAACTQNEYKSR